MNQGFLWEPWPCGVINQGTGPLLSRNRGNPVHKRLSPWAQASLDLIPSVTGLQSGHPAFVFSFLVKIPWRSVSGWVGREEIRGGLESALELTAILILALLPKGSVTLRNPYLFFSFFFSLSFFSFLRDSFFIY